MRGTPRVSTRASAVVLALELPFWPLAVAAHAWLVGASAEAAITVLAPLTVGLLIVKSVILAAVVRRGLRPLDRRLRETRDGAPVEGLAEARKIVGRLPEVGGATNALGFTLAFVVATLVMPWLGLDLAASRPSILPMIASFLLALLLGVFAPTYLVLSRTLMPAMTKTTLVVGRPSRSLPGEARSLRTRVVVLTLCAALGPSAWMLSLAYLDRGTSGIVVGPALFLFAVVVVLWSAVVAHFLASTVVTPIREIRAIVDGVGRLGAGTAGTRAPIYDHHELGRLAIGVNEMMDRLASAQLRSRRARKRVRDLLRSERRHAAELKAVIDNLVDGVFVCDERGRLLHINRAATELVGTGPTTAAELVDALEMRRPDGSRLPREEMPLLRALDGQVATLDCVARPIDGRPAVALHLKAAPIADHRGEIVGAVASARDVTEEVEIDRFKTQFITVAAHELKTPIAVVKGYASALLHDLKDPRVQLAEGIARGADRMDRIVSDLLLASELHFGRVRLERAPIDLTATAQEIARAKSTAQNRAIAVAGDRYALAEGDASRIEHVVSELVENAVKYSPGDRPVLVRVGSSNGEVVLSVKDEGVGIPREKQARIFRPFFRAHTDTPYDRGGLGVGLHICNALVKQQGGRLWFDSAEGEGSTFFMALPRARRDEHASDG